MVSLCFHLLQLTCIHYDACIWGYWSKTSGISDDFELGNQIASIAQGLTEGILLVNFSLPGLHLLFVPTGCPCYIHTVQLNEPRNYPHVILREAIITEPIKFEIKTTV